MYTIIFGVLVFFLFIIISLFLVSFSCFLAKEILDIDLGGILLRKLKKTKLYNKLKSME